MNIFWHEIKANRKSLLVWSAVMVLLVLTAVAKFSAFHNNPESLAILDSIPKSVLDGMNMRAFNLVKLDGFFGVVFSYFSLMGAMAAAMWGSESIAREERDKTVEFSLVLPITRSKLVTAKLLAALVNCVLFVLITWGASALSVRAYQPDAGFYKFLGQEMAAMFLIELVFLAMGVLLGCVLKKYKLAGSMAISIILTAYVLFVVSRMHEKLDVLRFVTPFRYFDAADFYRSGTFEPLYLALSAGIIVVCLAAAYLVYARRDMMI